MSLSWHSNQDRRKSSGDILADLRVADDKVAGVLQQVVEIHDGRPVFHLAVRVDRRLHRTQ